MFKKSKKGLWTKLRRFLNDYKLSPFLFIWEAKDGEFLFVVDNFFATDRQLIA